jgi:hypothetical protein
MDIKNRAGGKNPFFLLLNFNRHSYSEINHLHICAFLIGPEVNSFPKKFRIPLPLKKFNCLMMFQYRELSTPKAMH